MKAINWLREQSRAAVIFWKGMTENEVPDAEDEEIAELQASCPDWRERCSMGLESGKELRIWKTEKPDVSLDFNGWAKSVHNQLRYKNILN